jgi:MFS family permease
MVAAVGLVIGPVLGGALVEIGWSWVFWFNVPLGALGCLWAALVLRDLVRHDVQRGLDVPGTVCCVIGLTTLTFALSKGGLTGWGNAYVIGGLIAAAVFLPLWVLIERHTDSPMLDLTIFQNRLFAAAAAAAFINGLARFALTFLFVFYFQGPQGQDPITAGIELAPMAGGMVVASPIAGRIADRHGSRLLAALGMLISAVALAGMTTLGVHTPYWESAVWLALVGIGSGVFMSPNTAAMMAAVPSNRRGVASGARTMLQNMGAVLSISFVMAVITSAVPKKVLFSIFSGVTSGLDAKQLAPFIDNMHTALWTLCAVSVVGCIISLMRPKHVREPVA